MALGRRHGAGPLARRAQQGVGIKRRAALRDLCDAEVLSAFRSLTAKGTLVPAVVTPRLVLFRRLPLHRFSHGRLLERAFEYRDNFSACDALYVALAERLGAPLMSGDGRLRDAVRRFSPVRLFDPHE